MTSFFLQLKAITIVLLTLVLISASPVAAEKHNHTKAQDTSTVIKVQDGDTIELANGMEVQYLDWIYPKPTVRKSGGYFEVKASKFNKKLDGGRKTKLEYYGTLLTIISSEKI